MRPTCISHSKSWNGRFVLLKIQVPYSWSLFTRKGGRAFSFYFFIYHQLRFFTSLFGIIISSLSSLLMREIQFLICWWIQICGIWSLSLTKDPNDRGIPISLPKPYFITLYIIGNPPQTICKLPCVTRILISLFCINAEPGPNMADKYVV